MCQDFRVHIMKMGVLDWIRRVTNTASHCEGAKLTVLEDLPPLPLQSAPRLSC
jgi:hypothetical protein